MAKSKKLTEDQLNTLDMFCNDYCLASDDLINYIDEVIGKKNDGYIIVSKLKESIKELQEKIGKLVDVAETNDWELLEDEDEEYIDPDDDDSDDDI